MEYLRMFLYPCSDWDCHQQKHYQCYQSNHKRQRFRQINAKDCIQRIGASTCQSKYYSNRE